MTRKLPWLVAAIWLGAGAATFCAADILVTQDGQQIETEGPWTVKGRQVIFTTPEGRLTSIRLTEVDLEASELATNPPPPPPPVPGAEPDKPKAPPKPILVLTDDNIGGGAQLETFLGRLTSDVEEKVRLRIEGTEGDPEDDAETQAKLDAMTGRMDIVLGTINDTCSGYSTLDEALTTDDQLASFADELAACADDIEVESRELEDEAAKGILADVVAEMRSASSQAQSNPQAFLSEEPEPDSE